jgi:hypothetical protein
MIHRTKQAVLADWRLKSTVAMIVLTVATVLVANVEPAHAASEIGPYGPAIVWCDASTNTIWASPFVGAGDMYSGQSIRYRFWAVNRETGKSFWLGSDQWMQMYHQRVGEPYYDILGNYYPGQITPYHPNPPLWHWNVYESTLTLHNGWNRLHVFVQYQWYSSTYRTWVGNATAETRTYSNATYAVTAFTGWASYPDCYL